MNRSMLCTTVFAMGLAGPASGQLVVRDTYTNQSAQSLANVPVTFSRVGGDGDFSAGITPRIGKAELPAQVDVLRTAPDGSIRHALVSFVVPSVPASGDVTIDWLNKAPQEPLPFNWAGHDAVPPALRLDLAAQAYGGLVSDLGAALSAQGWYGPDIDVLHDGPVMKEFQWVHVPAGQPANQYVTVYWRVRLFSGQPSMRVEAIVENCNPRVANVPTPLHYPFWGVTLRHNGAILYQAGAYDHLDQTRYRIVSWTAGQIENIHRKPNTQYLVENRIFPPYTFNNSAPPQYRNMTAAKADSIYAVPFTSDGRNDDVRPQGILEQGIIYDFMGATGGRWDIGLYPAWTVTYLLTQAPGIYQRILHADGNGAGSYYIHMRSDEGYPGFNTLTLPPNRQPQSSLHRIDIYQFPHRPDHAHAPSLGYVAYILTGDQYYAEEMSFWASFQLGEWPWIGMDVNAPERAQAWGFRHVVDAAFIMPDGHPLLPYFTGRINAYTTTLNTQFVQSGRPIHFFNEAPESSGRMEWVNCWFTSNWQTGWLLSSMNNAVDKGYAQLHPFRNWLSEYLIGFYTSSKDPAHDFVGPGGMTYKYDPKDAVPYSSATSLWQCEVFMESNNTPDPSDDYLATRKISKIKNFSKYGEIWYYNKVNQDNEWPEQDIYNGQGQLIRPAGLDPAMPLPQGLDLANLPDNTIGNWPVRSNGWGHGMYYWHLDNPPHQGPWWNWHRHGAWDGLVSAMNGNAPGASDAWAEMLPLAGQTDYGFELVPQALYVPGTPAPSDILRLEVRPHTEAKSPGGFVDYSAIAHYRNPFGIVIPVDVTGGVTWESGNPAVATFTGARLNVTGQGLVAVRATLNGTSLTNDRPVILAATTDHRPIVLYAGWDDTYAIRGVPSRTAVTARVADLDDDVISVNLLSAGTLLVKLRDNATHGDAFVGDGVYTWAAPNYTHSTEGDTYYEIVALDAAAQQSNPWPYLTVGAPSAPPASGFPVIPFASEDYGFMTRLRGVGLGLTSLQPGVPGTVTMLAESAGDPVERVRAFLDGVMPRLAGLNDGGIAPDQFAGDGLYTGQAVVTLGTGTHLIDMVPFREVAPLIGPGDAYPRFRVHANAPASAGTPAPRP